MLITEACFYIASLIEPLQLPVAMLQLAPIYLQLHQGQQRMASKRCTWLKSQQTPPSYADYGPLTDHCQQLCIFT